MNENATSSALSTAASTWAAHAPTHGSGLGELLQVVTIGVALLAATVIVFAMVRGKRVGLDVGMKLTLLLGLGVLPAIATTTGLGAVMELTKAPEACGSCHVMTPYVEDMKNPASTTLAAKHYKNRYIPESQCFECHSSYGIGGILDAKVSGLGHIYRYLTGRYEEPITLHAKSYLPNCMKCHAESQKFLGVSDHQDAAADLQSGKMKCTECHDSPHPRPAKKEAEEAAPAGPETVPEATPAASPEPENGTKP